MIEIIYAQHVQTTFRAVFMIYDKLLWQCEMIHFAENFITLKVS